MIEKCKNYPSTEPLATTWENERWIRRIFPIVCSVPGVRTEFIYPLQQKAAAAIHEAMKGDPRIDSITLFGSSVTLRCTIHSDLDLCVKLKPEDVSREAKNEISERIQEACDWNADILWEDSLSLEDRVFRHIKEMGVRIL